MNALGSGSKRYTPCDQIAEQYVAGQNKT